MKTKEDRNNVEKQNSVPIVSSDRCINPYKVGKEKSHIRKSLRKISGSLLKKFPNLPNAAKVCSASRKKSDTVNNISTDSGIHNNLSSSLSDPDDSIMVDSEDNSFNEVISSNDKSCQTEEYKSPREVELEELLQELRTKYESSNEYDPLRTRILTIAPESWSLKKITKEFGATMRQVKKSKLLKLQGGVLAETAKKSGNSLSQSTVDKIIEFYNDDANGRIMPGMKDVKSIKIDNKRVQVQKRLMLLDLRELCLLYKESHKENPVGFSTFAKLKPKNCLLAGANGTHIVCVCTIHQNIKLMLQALNIKKLTENLDNPLSDYKDCLKRITCKNPTNECHLNNCKKCPSIDDFSEFLIELLEEHEIYEIQYDSWTGTDRSTMETLVKSAQDFVDDLCYRLKVLKPHSFITKQQSAFISETKENLKEDEVLVMFDFAQNYAFHAQDAAQAFHFNNDQVTVFSVIYYYKKHGKLQHTSCVFLSDSLKHDTAAVYAIQSKLIPEIKKTVPKVKKLKYFTDGAKQHFKNRFQIANLINHQTDFNLVAEWHFSISAHGKSAFDGIGAFFKREAYRASLLAKPGKQILNFLALLNWALQHFKDLKIYSYDKIYHEKMRRKLNKRFENVSQVTGILSHHSFQVSSDKKIFMKKFSKAKTGTEVECV